MTCENCMKFKLSVSINKALLEHSCTHPFTYYPWLLWVIATDTVRPEKPKLFTVWSFSEKFASPCFRRWEI